MKYIVAHDLGTSGNKATLFTTEGKLVKAITHRYNTNYFNGNWAEQNPLDWWQAVCKSTKALLKDTNIDKVEAVSFSGQMMGCVCVDSNGEILRNAIIWADQRSVKEAEELRNKMDEKEFYYIAGHRISPSYSIEKLMWIKNNEPEVFKKVYKMLQAKDYIIYKLTGRFVTDYSDASGTNAFDLNSFQWNKKILSNAGIPEDMLPELYPSTEIIGEIDEQVSEECGLPVGTKVVLGGGDGVCASVGAASIEEGITYNYLGSSSWISLTSKKPIYDEQMRIFNWAHIVPGYIAPTGTMQAAGNSFSWIKETIGDYEDFMAEKNNTDVYEMINNKIKESSIGANNLLFLPYILGERSPRWNENARGSFIGLKMEHNKKDLYRAVVEGVFYNLAIILEIFKEQVEINEINVIGGLAQGDIQRRMMADIYGVDICKLNYLEEATSMGAAVTAGVAIGELSGFEDIHKFIFKEDKISPIRENQLAYKRMKEIFEDSYNALIKVYDSLALENQM